MRRRLIPDIVNLQAFECAARHQNFSRAAEELNLTQSAVSRQISELEQQTGLKLFERVRQRVVLSEAGLRLLPEVKDLLLRSERLMIGAVAAGQMKLSLKVATLPTFGTRWLVPRLGHFLEEHRDVALTVESRSKPFSFDEDNFDLAIHYGLPAWAGAVATFLCNETVLPVAGRQLAGRLKLGGPEDLSLAPLLHLTTRPKLWAQWFDLQKLPTEHAYPGARFDQFSMIIAAAISGLGRRAPAHLSHRRGVADGCTPASVRPADADREQLLCRHAGKETDQRDRDALPGLAVEPGDATVPSGGQ